MAKSKDNAEKKAAGSAEAAEKSGDGTKGAAAAGTQQSKKEKKEEEELSEEDQKLKEELEMLVERLRESDASLYNAALEALKNFIRTSTSSMTAVPKPLKFLLPHFEELVNVYESWEDSSLKSQLADILSVLGMTHTGESKRETLHYRLLSNIDESISDWGHEYVRHLALEIAAEYQERSEEETPVNDLIDLSFKIVPFFLKHNAEVDAVDLLLEIESIDSLVQFVDKDTYQRVCLYMVSCVPLLAPPDDSEFLNTAYNLYLSHGQLPQALAMAIRIDDQDLIRTVFQSTTDISLQKQLAFILARQNYWLQLDNEEVQQCLSNSLLATHYKYLAKELNLLEPKAPEDIYKSHLEQSRFGQSAGVLDSAKQNLASAFANAFLNCGYGTDKLILTEDETNSWIYKTKGHGMYSTTASLGMIFQWQNEEGLQQIDKYLYSSDEQIKAGALLGIGLVNSGIHEETDSTLALLNEYIDNPSVTLRSSAIVGLGLSYAGSRREDLVELISPLVSDAGLTMQLSSLAALSLGQIFVGSANGDITSTILQALLERSEAELSDKWTVFMALGLALLYMGKSEDTEEVLETIKAIDHPISRTIEALVRVCSYSGTGNVLQIQKLLHECIDRPKPKREESEEEEGTENGEGVGEDGAEGGEGAESGEGPEAGEAGETDEGDKSGPGEAEEESEKNKRDFQFQGVSVLGIAVIAMGEDIGQDMVLRHFGHLMHYGDAIIRRAVPLAMGLVSVSNPQMKVFDTLSRYSHDNDMDVAINAIFAMGLVGAGTNNARIAQLLRQLATYYSRDGDCLFMIRIAQGLLHAGKGATTLSPFNTDRQILSRVSLAGLLTVCVGLLSPRNFILGNAHSTLYYLALAIRPRMLITLDEDLNPVKVSVRVGQAVDVVGQAGKPKTITGWVTHNTPVLLGHGERAELEDDEYISLASSLEGVVIIKKNADRMETD